MHQAFQHFFRVRVPPGICIWYHWLMPYSAHQILHEDFFFTCNDVYVKIFIHHYASEETGCQKNHPQLLKLE